jgi:hypothetical protein
MNDTNTTVTALQGFKRRPVETTHKRREGHLPEALMCTMKPTAAKQGR